MSKKIVHTKMQQTMEQATMDFKNAIHPKACLIIAMGQDCEDSTPMMVTAEGRKIEILHLLTEAMESDPELAEILKMAAFTVDIKMKAANMPVFNGLFNHNKKVHKS